MFEVVFPSILTCFYISCRGEISLWLFRQLKVLASNLLWTLMKWCELSVQTGRMSCCMLQQFTNILKLETLIIQQIHGIEPIWAMRWKSYWNANPHFTENWQHLSPLELQWYYPGLPQIASATKPGNNCLRARTCCHSAWNNPSY